jgi:hypothetical protein
LDGQLFAELELTIRGLEHAGGFELSSGKKRDEL